MRLLTGQRDKKLSPEAYEVMLNEFVQITPEQLPEMVRRWKGLYNPRTVQHAIDERLKYAPDEKLEEAVGEFRSHMPIAHN